MAIVYEVTLLTRYFGQACVNRWNYLGSGTPISTIPSFALLSAMGFIDASGAMPTGTVGGLIQAQSPDELVFIQALARTVTDENPTNFFDYAYPAGTIGANSAGLAMSPIDAYGFRTNRVRTDIARGTKRFVGVTEGAVTSGGNIEPTVLTGLNTLAVAMTASLSYTTGGESLAFAPVICKKLEYTTPSGKRGYKYYSTQALQQAQLAQGIVWQPYDTVRSQVSRQYK